MAGLVKLACLVLACMIVAGPITSKAALSCGTVNTNVAACIGYLTQGGPLPRACCTGVSKLNSIARTTPDRKQACRCLKTAASALGSGLNAGRAAGLPKACGVNVPFPISTSINCNGHREISSVRMKLEWIIPML
uniref:Non-specific lipid-transfer protein n=1 Tax=Brassica campestris TaxID=3711 RepID=M4CLL1_BRACM